MLVKDDPIVVEQVFDASMQLVWDALTELEQLHQWLFPQIPEFKAEVGFATQFILQNGERSFTHLWKITELAPKQFLKMNWSYLEYPGDSFIQYELEQLGHKTKLKLSTHVVEDFSQDIPEFQRKSAVDGWNYLIKESLLGFLRE